MKKFISLSFIILSGLMASTAYTRDLTPTPFAKVTCGNHWLKITGVVASSSNGSSIKLSGDSIPGGIVTPAEVQQYLNETVFKATDGSGRSLRIVFDEQSQKYFGILRDSAENDESDLGECSLGEVPE